MAAVMHRTSALLLLLMLLPGACAPARPAADRPARPTVVSLNPCTDAILLEVADPEQVLAISHYSKDPAASSIDPDEAARFPATRGTVEEAVALAPDLVIGSSFIDPASRAAYARLGLRLETFGSPVAVKDSREQVRRIAALVGHPQRGEALVARIDAALTAALPAPGRRPVDTVLWQSGGMVAGEQTLIADLLRRTGFTLARRGFAQGDRPGLERLLADPPGVLLVAGEGGLENLALGHPVLERLAGTARVAFDQRLLFCGGPTIVRAAERLARIREQAR